MVIGICTIYAAKADDCQGPPEMCQQINDLQGQVEDLKSSNTAMKANPEDDISDKMAKAIAAAGALALFLKMLMSVLKSWKGRVHTDRDKALIRAATLIVSVLTFLATNVGAGLPWWQALVISGGGPGAIALHEIMKLIPVIQGKTRLPKSDPPPNLDA